MEPYLNSDLPVAERVSDLVSRLTLEEKISQTLHESPAIPRLGMPDYNWWNECLHGVARAGVATVFPQAIGLAATWDTELMHRVATAISDEARAKHHAAKRRGNHGQYLGLTYWTPNINIFRDPRWGRGHETYGEDPWLTGSLGVAFVRGLQGDDPRYLKVVATPKHFAVHSGPEQERHGFNAVVNGKDLRETYLAAFKACVMEGRAASIMGAYNRANGEHCCASQTLLGDILRGEWGFSGCVVSDCGAIDDIHLHHKLTANAAESAALAVRNGCDLNCGETYRSLADAVNQGLITEADIETALSRVLTARFRLGMFDPDDRVPYAAIPETVIDSPGHRALALQAARASIVLLKNDGALPLRRDLKAITVTGPSAGDLEVLLANYNGLNARLVTLIEGICGRVSPATAVNWMPGCKLTGTDTGGFGPALHYAAHSDVVIAVMGLSPRLEGEEGDTADSDAGGDRRHLDLPGVQEEFLKQLHATGRPVVLVLLNGSAVAVNWAQENLAAIVEAWYPGEEGGTAVADVLFGDYNPGGRLPVTFYKSVEDLPGFNDYSMASRTYRYFGGETLYPFGFGLSYSSFEYSGLRIAPQRCRLQESVEVEVQVRNTGRLAGDEVVQLYLTDLDAPKPAPIRSLRGFTRLHLAPGETGTVRFTLAPEQFARFQEDGSEVIAPGKFKFTIGGGQPIAVGDYTPPHLSTTIERTG